MLARILSAGFLGTEGYKVSVEVDISAGLPSFNIVGLPDSAVKESKERVRSALKNSGFDYPSKRIVVNLAPADIKKEGPLYDLPIALGILACQGILKLQEGVGVVGELSLDGKVNPIRGALVIALCMENDKKLFVPKANAKEAAIGFRRTFGVESLGELVTILRGEMETEPESVDLNEIFSGEDRYEIDFSDIKGQESAKRALEVAAAGGHNVLMIGPPGAGKTLLARALPSILPPLGIEEALELTKIYSVAGLLKGPIVRRRPFRAPHHTISDVALIGGGTVPKPGEVSLAHNGVLFLDELPEFKRQALEALRVPLEDGFVTISRAQRTLIFPASVQLVTAMNPCPCGFFRDPKKECRCTPNQIKRYLGRISGPFLDRMDMQIDVPALSVKELGSEGEGELSCNIREKVERAREIQRIRFRGEKIKMNAKMTPRMIRKYCKLSEPAQEALEMSARKLGFSARVWHKVIKVARTIADIEGSDKIEAHHVFESVSMRRIERYYSSL